jgi:hypothetical protein
MGLQGTFRQLSQIDPHHSVREMLERVDITPNSLDRTGPKDFF